MATIGIVHFGLAGHVGPASRLGAVLARQGHRVVAWGPGDYREQIEQAGAELRPHSPVAPLWFEGGLAGFAAEITSGTRHHVGELIEGLLAEQADLVIHDCHALWGRVAAEFLGLPRIVSQPLFPAPPPPASKGEVEHRAPRGWTEAVKRAETDRTAIGCEWGIDIGAWTSAMTSSGEVTVSYTIEEIMGDPDPLPGWQYVGPLMDPRPRQPRADPPLVYVALGTYSNFREDVYRAAIEAMADEPVQVVVSTGRGILEPADLEPLPANAKAFSFVDSREVLGRARAHITHAGGGSVHESLLAGVPMVCLPQGVDQPLWAQRMHSLGAAETIDVAPQAIKAAVRRLLEDDQPRARADALGQKLISYNGAERAIKLVDRLLAANPATASAT